MNAPTPGPAALEPWRAAWDAWRVEGGFGPAPDTGDAESDDRWRKAWTAAAQAGHDALAAQEPKSTPGEASPLGLKHAVTSNRLGHTLAALREIAEPSGDEFPRDTARNALDDDAAIRDNVALTREPKPAPGTLRADLEATVKTWREEGEPYPEDDAADIARRGGIGYCANELAQILTAHLQPTPELAHQRDHVGTIENTETGATWVSWDRRMTPAWPEIASAVSRLSGGTLLIREGVDVDESEDPDRAYVVIERSIAAPARPTTDGGNGERPAVYARFLRTSYPTLADHEIADAWRSATPAECAFWRSLDVAQDARPAPELVPALPATEGVYLYHWRFDLGEEFGLYWRKADADAMAARRAGDEGFAMVLGMAILGEHGEPKPAPELAELIRLVAGWERQAFNATDRSFAAGVRHAAETLRLLLDGDGPGADEREVKNT